MSAHPDRPPAPAPEPDSEVSPLGEDGVRLRLALEASQAGTWLSELATRQMHCDTRTRELLGLPADGVVSFEAATACLHEADREAMVARFTAASQPGGADTWDAQFRVVHADGAVLWIQGLGRVYRDESGRAVRFIGINLDITERKRVEQALRETTTRARAHARELEARTAQLRRLASALTLAEQRARETLSHTLHDGVQQLMFSASLRVERLIRRQRAAGASDEDLQLLVHTRNDIEEAIVGVRSLAVELFPPVLKDRRLPDALLWLATWMKEKYGLHVDMSVDQAADTPNPHVRTLLFDSVRELLFNVVKHAGVSSVAVTLRAEADGPLHIRVADQGVGLPPTWHHGEATGPTGLGLMSIRERLALLGGHFRIDSAPGCGTTFELTVPLTPPHDAPATADQDARVPPSEWRRLRVLVVDDHELVREGLCDLIAGLPAFEVVGEAGDGVDALNLARMLQPDVVIMDISMPRMDGVEATRRIRALLPSASIIGLSAESRTGARHPIEQAGADAYIAKDESSRLLVECLQGVARRGRPS